MRLNAVLAQPAINMTPQQRRHQRCNSCVEPHRLWMASHACSHSGALSTTFILRHHARQAALAKQEEGVFISTARGRH